MPERRVAIYRRKSLAEAADGWTDECYVDYRPASIEDLQNFSKLKVDDKDNDALINEMKRVCKDHFIRGKIMVFDDNGKTVLDDMRKDDIDVLPPAVWQELFTDITGGSLDPKGTPKAPPAAAAAPNSAASTATPSSAA